MDSSRLIIKNPSVKKFLLLFEKNTQLTYMYTYSILCSEFHNDVAAIVNFDIKKLAQIGRIFEKFHPACRFKRPC